MKILSKFLSHVQFWLAGIKSSRKISIHDWAEKEIPFVNRQKKILGFHFRPSFFHDIAYTKERNFQSHSLMHIFSSECNDGLMRELQIENKIDRKKNV